MRFGEEASPRIYTWGNPGVPSTWAPNNVTMAVARATEGGNFSRNYVPMHDASTTDPVVRQVRFPQDELDKHSFKSIGVVTFSFDSTPQAVLAIDRAGRMWTWGMDMSGSQSGQPRDPTGLGGPDVSARGVQAAMHRPVRVLMQSERDGTTVTWSKVQCRPRQPVSVALTEDGTLYGTGALADRLFLDTAKPTGFEATTVANHFVPLSTQTWKDFAFFGASIYAIRDDGTLHTKDPTVFPSSSIGSDNQLKGFLVDATFDVPCFLGTGTSRSLSYAVRAAPAGGRNASVSVARDTATGEYRPYVSLIGRDYTATPTVTRSVTPATATTPTLTLRLSNDTAWARVESNGDALVLFEDKGTAGRDVFMFKPGNRSIPDGGFIERHNGSDCDIFNVAKPERTDDRIVQPIANATACAISFDQLRGTTTVPPDFALRLSLSHTNNSNIVAWGQNANGCLAVGHTNRQRTLAFVQSPDTAEFFASSISLGGNYSLAIRFGLTSGLLYCAGKHEFSGNSAATASMTAFTWPTPQSVNVNHLGDSTAGRYWYSAFAHSWNNEQLSIASRDHRAEATYADDGQT